MIRKQNNIQFHFIVASFYFPKRAELKTFLLKLFKTEGYKVRAINYIFCTDSYLLKLNRNYLNHNTYTDIVTFGLSKEKEAIVADIYISIDRVKENAIVFQTKFGRELYRVIFHGALHLCGYKDKKPNDVKRMRFKEDFYLSRYFVSRETSHKT